ncbi:hypothetical protein G9G54_13625 [Paenibacillus sp. EKM212P]|uniref:zinc-finger-containing protein n=1 Tax=Paenibacillus sp. EKM212P TaxID=1683680 RepID=UPI0013EDE15C|nr:zinc-finger-containing protein [Paenibacillus sp. EKM212P]KAF6578311.1 hypothetical protein G9G54_13625 [Paenibacillus sp. EKM212P]
MIEKCNYCGSQVICVSTKEFYGRDYGGNIWKCTSCDAYVGTHKGSKVPLGTLANKELRQLRNQAHALFDPYWRKGRMSRHGAYRKLSEFMNLPKAETHIGMFDVDKCRKLINGFADFIEKGVVNHG